MNAWRQILGVTVCAVLVAAFECGAMVWSFGDVAPGRPLEPVERQVRLAALMSLPFDGPLHLLSPLIRGSVWSEVVQWLVLPLMYGALLYFLLAVIAGKIRSHARRTA